MYSRTFNCMYSRTGIDSGLDGRSNSLLLPIRFCHVDSQIAELPNQRVPDLSVLSVPNTGAPTGQARPVAFGVRWELSRVVPQKLPTRVVASHTPNVATLGSHGSY